MLKKPFFLETFVLLVIVGTLNWLASVYDLYWSVYEFDSLVHFLGGATLAAFFIWFYFYSGVFGETQVNLKRFLLVAMTGAMFLAVAWEIYEFLIGEVNIMGLEYPFDTTLDFVMDFLGALAFCFYGYLKETKSEALNPKSENISNFDIQI